jgi:cold shock protein
MKGIVKFFSENKGYGFIKDQYGREIFVHVSGTLDRIEANDKVEFETEEGRDGKPVAIMVKRQKWMTI